MLKLHSLNFYAGAKLGKTKSSDISWYEPRNAILIEISQGLGLIPTRFVIIRTPSSNSTTAITKGQLIQTQRVPDNL